MNTNYFYYRNNKYNVTIAYNSSEGYVTYGASFCRPGDNFTKSLGRKIAEGRMNSCNKKFVAPGTRWMTHELILTDLEAGEVEYAPRSFKI